MSDLRKIRLKDRIEFVAILAVAKFLQSLSVETAASFCAFFWRRIAPRTRRHRRVVEHLRLAFPHLTGNEIDKLSIKVWDNLGRVMGETFHLHDLMHKALASDHDFASIEEVRKRQDQGIVIGSGHIGAYEIVVMAAHFYDYKPTGIYQELSNPLVDDFLSAQRQPMFPGGLLPKSHKTARKVLGIVKNGGAAAFLADQREFKGIEVEFFGQPAYCNPFPALLARHCNVPFVGGRVIRRLGGAYTFSAHFVDVPVTKDSAADVQAGTQNFHTLLEHYIRQYPEQWMWTHRKWALPPAPKPKQAGNRSAIAAS